MLEEELEGAARSRRKWSRDELREKRVFVFSKVCFRLPFSFLLFRTFLCHFHGFTCSSDERERERERERKVSTGSSSRGFRGFGGCRKGKRRRRPFFFFFALNVSRSRLTLSFFLERRTAEGTLRHQFALFFPFFFFLQNDRRRPLPGRCRPGRDRVLGLLPLVCQVSRLEIRRGRRKGRGDGARAFFS